MPPAEKKSSAKKMLQSVTISVVFGEAVSRQGRQKPEVIKQRKTQVSHRFARVENSCKKNENNRKKRVFLLDKRLKLWYNIYNVKRRRVETPQRITTPRQCFETIDYHDRKASQAAQCVRKSTCTPNVSSGAD